MDRSERNSNRSWVCCCCCRWCRFHHFYVSPPLFLILRKSIWTVNSPHSCSRYQLQQKITSFFDLFRFSLTKHILFLSLFLLHLKDFFLFLLFIHFVCSFPLKLLVLNKTTKKDNEIETNPNKKKKKKCSDFKDSIPDPD